MPKRLLLEGTDIEELLTQVRDEHGPDVSIVSADRVRTGGIAGFFARQRYELTVEVNDEPARPAARQQAPATGTTAAGAPADPMAALLARAEEQERRLGAPAAARPAAEAPQRPAASVSLATAARTAPFDPAQAVPAQGSAPQLRAQAGAVPAQLFTAPAPLVAPENFVVETGTENQAFADMLAALQRGTTAEAAVAEAASAARSGAMVARAYQPPAPAQEQPGAMAVRAYQPPAVEQDRPYAGALMELGMPEHMARRATGPDMYGAVKQALAGLPAAPAAPSRPGDVLVIVGETHAALRVAGEVVRALNLGSGQLLLAARSTAGTEIHAARRLSGPAAAIRKARKIHRDDVPYVVVVASTPEEGNGEWARSVADGLGATAVWAVVDATRKTADTARHLRSLGKVDAITVNAVDATGDPASVLALDLPVSYLADRPCTPQAWVGLLCERLEEMQS
ncbi:hypothetical protein [Planomonospora venezuelensis]|uniref:Uncharacterized protein n=1 Tax=Planomonospora venezuelensis TaxID=1999 RepID=A0A841DB99_PLAVE|nr:hypothetical protein [Planomonospora venezuelensis]MBB5967290.1 hypothetical protein [Planomonospora venezuelensis]GIM98555.1 hypothetical protein Pve01_02140 [Planomonospora venezuelensis]